MGHRESIYRIRRAPAISPPSPNDVTPEITVELRINYPAGTPVDRINGHVILICREAIEEAYLRQKALPQPNNRTDAPSPTPPIPG